MNVQYDKTDDLNAILTITLTPEDYKPAVEKGLKDVQRSVSVPGFRPGKAPMGLVKKSYGQNVMVDEINKMASDQLFGYLRDNNIDVLGQPLMSNTAESKINFETEEDFVFAFDLGLAPQFDINISNEDVLTLYKIKLDDEMVEKEIDNLKKRHAEMTDVDVAGEKDVIYATVTELDDENNPLDGGVNNQSISLTPELVKNEELQKQLIGIAKETEIVVDIFALFNDNETVISSSLNIPKEGVNDLNKNFRLKVTDIKHFDDAEMGQAFFDKVFGPGVVQDEDTFRQKIKEEVGRYYENEANHHLEHEVSHLIGDKHTFDLPDAFLKRWLVNGENEGYTPENIDSKYAQEKAGLRYTLVRQRFQEKYELEVSKEDIENASMGYTYNLFAQYGMQNADASMVKTFSDEQLKKDDYRARMHDIAMNRAVIQKVKELVSIEEKEVTADEFYEIISAHNHAHHGHSHDDHDHEHDHDHEGHEHAHA